MEKLLLEALVELGPYGVTMAVLAAMFVYLDKRHAKAQEKILELQKEERADWRKERDEWRGDIKESNTQTARAMDRLDNTIRLINNRDS